MPVGNQSIFVRRSISVGAARPARTALTPKRSDEIRRLYRFRRSAPVRIGAHELPAGLILVHVAAASNQPLRVNRRRHRRVAGRSSNCGKTAWPTIRVVIRCRVPSRRGVHDVARSACRANASVKVGAEGDFCSATSRVPVRRRSSGTELFPSPGGAPSRSWGGRRTASTHRQAIPTDLDAQEANRGHADRRIAGGGCHALIAGRTRRSNP